MEQTTHIAVFARAPVAGAAKTRLIPLLGAEGAAAAQRAMTLHALRTAAAAAPGQVSLWSAGDQGHPFFNDCMQRFHLALQPQPEGDLGARMAGCLRMLLCSHRNVLLIGSDCPALRADDLLAARRALEQGARMVFTPAADGGYVLVGARMPEPGQEKKAEQAFEQAFTSIAWGGDQVMAQTRLRLQAMGWRQGSDWAELPALWDVDTPADYRRALAAGLPVG